MVVLFEYECCYHVFFVVQYSFRVEEKLLSKADKPCRCVITWEIFTRRCF